MKQASLWWILKDRTLVSGRDHKKMILKNIWWPLQNNYLNCMKGGTDIMLLYPVSDGGWWKNIWLINWYDLDQNIQFIIIYWAWALMLSQIYKKCSQKRVCPILPYLSVFKVSWFYSFRDSTFLSTVSCSSHSSWDSRFCPLFLGCVVLRPIPVRVFVFSFCVSPSFCVEIVKFLYFLKNYMWYRPKYWRSLSRVPPPPPVTATTTPQHLQRHGVRAVRVAVSAAACLFWHPPELSPIVYGRGRRPAGGSVCRRLGRRWCRSAGCGRSLRYTAPMMWSRGTAVKVGILAVFWSF